MDNSFDYMMDMLFGMIVIMISVTFTITVFAMGTDYNQSLTKEIGQKASSRYTMNEYGDIHIYISKTDAFADILASQPTVNIQINGVDLNADILQKARNSETVAVRTIKNSLTQTKYRKVPTYNSNGTILSINYIGG